MVSVSDIAIVIPVHGDAASLARLLDTAGAWPERPRELVVISSTDEDSLRALCQRHGCRHEVVADSRGGRLDAGARAAQARVLWFLHADAAPPAEGLRAIERALATGAESGCFRFAFQGPPTWYKAALERMVRLRGRAGGMVYGDQGIFALRSVYLECGGFAHQPLFEEVRLVKRLRSRGTFRLLAEPIGVSTRRWERDGWVRRTLHNRWLALRHMCGARADRLASSYRRPLRSGKEIDS